MIILIAMHNIKVSANNRHTNLIDLKLFQDSNVSNDG